MVTIIQTIVFTGHGINGVGWVYKGPVIFNLQNRPNQACRNLRSTRTVQHVECSAGRPAGNDCYAAQWPPPRNITRTRSSCAPGDLRPRLWSHPKWPRVCTRPTRMSTIWPRFRVWVTDPG